MADDTTDIVEQLNDQIADILMAISEVGVGDYSVRVEMPDETDTPLEALCLGINEMIESLEQRQLEAEQNEEKIRMLSEQTITGLLIMQGGVFKYANERYFELIGHAREEVLGWGPREFVESLVHEEDQMMVAEWAQNPPGPDEAQNLQWRILTKDGEVRWVDTYRRAVMYEGEPAEYMVTMDITERRKARDELETQSRAIMEMSTPAIRIWDGMLLMPLVGAIDTARSQQIITTMLESIADVETKVAILDVTGVPFIDTSVARHILNAVDGAKILGAEVIVSGFSPEAAQTLAQLGVDFSALRTSGSLKAAMQRAFEIVRNR